MIDKALEVIYIHIYIQADGEIGDVETVCIAMICSCLEIVKYDCPDLKMVKYDLARRKACTAAPAGVLGW